ncbi:MAG: methylenetetrahydrofolate reductase [NAD(P)H] [Candidatus Sumerlaeota bacterium]|nr:methylenetetrahydrofolate reductase [NAD(P)H] [Candidatus Sumerlaeota bacterium]
MKISDILAQPGPTFSFEFFPPKDDAAAQQLFEAIQDLGPLAPTFVSVTYGAGGSTRRRTVDLVKTIKAETGIETMAHLTCVGATREEIASVLDELRAAGIENIMALRGDPPEGEAAFRAVAGGFAHANELIAFIRGRHAFCVGAACYPEGHVESRSAEADLVHAKWKVDAGANFLVTQLFFDNEVFFRFRDQAAMAGIAVPILAGIMPILSASGVRRMVSMCGASIPRDLAWNLDHAANDDEVRRIGIDHSYRQCRGLLEEGVKGIHFYTLNRSIATKAIWQRLTRREA